MSVNWLTTDTDQQLAVQSLKRAREIAKNWGIIEGPEVFPGDNVQTDAQLLEYIKETLTTIYHPSCTCESLSTSIPSIDGELVVSVFSGAVAAATHPPIF